MHKLSGPFPNPFKAIAQERADEGQQMSTTAVEGRELSAAATEELSCEFGSTKYFAMCAFGGLLACGITHTSITPLDLVKCRLQVNSEKYKNVANGFKVTIAEGGVRALYLGWAPTFIGYSVQGICKFGLYEFFKVKYANAIGEEKAYLYRTALYLASAASAEFFADLAYIPMESCKVRMQTSPTGTFPTTLRETCPKIYQAEGLNGFYKSIVPLWGRQIPYTMMKFTVFEDTVEYLYANVVPRSRSECSLSTQLIVTFTAGYVAGVFCAIVSHPADTIVSYMNKSKGSTLVSSYNDIGFVGLWKGLGPRIVMIGTLTAAQWFIYDAVKVQLKMPRPPPPEMPESLKGKL